MPYFQRLTSRGVQYELMVELWDQYDEYAVAHYSDFSLDRNTTNAQNDPDFEDYHLRVSGFWVENGVHDAGDALSAFDGARLSHRNRLRSSSYCFNYQRDNPGW